MGFRNLQAFNLALLAKQGWRILTNPTSLVARVFKAKYFPFDDVLHSRIGNNPSYAWRSIFNSLWVLKEGTRWRVGKKLAGWKGKLLSIGSQEILIKAVAQAVPTYTMSCFQLPKTLCDDSENMMRNFWWGQRNHESKLAWVSWKKMCKSKLYGGMGFRNLQAFNLALLAKQGWRILTNPTSLVARVFKAK